VEAAHDDPVAGGIEEGEGEALVPAGVLEGIEADEPDPRHGDPTRRLEGHRPVLHAGQPPLEDREAGLEGRKNRPELGRPRFAPVGDPASAPTPGEPDEAAEDDDRQDHHDGDEEQFRGRHELGPPNVDLDRTRRGRVYQPRLSGRSSRGRRRPTEPAEATSRAAVGLTPEEEARAAELERRAVEAERAAAPAPRRGAAAVVAVPRGARLLDPSEEYAYVARDLRRILIVQGSLVGILAVLWVLIEGLRIVRL
jgi:hypothetical protein